MPSEVELHRWLARAEGTGGLLGDDTARLPEPAPRTVTVDSQIEGGHFPAGLDPALLARRLLAVNLSDLAAAGARPVYAFLALSTPPGFDHRRFFEAFLAACRRHGLTLAGGDLARCPHGVVATLTLLGEPPAGGVHLTRSAAAAGHELWVGGTLGESAAGQRLLERGTRFDGERVVLPAELEAAPPVVAEAARRAVRRHLLPEPQLELGWALGRLPRIGAVMDVSDGLSLDLHRLCEASGVGAVVDAPALPTAPGFAGLCDVLEEDPETLVLGGGEDYVLLFTLPAGRPPPDGFPCRRIGAITGSRQVVVERDGRPVPLPPLGWNHLGG